MAVNLPDLVTPYIKLSDCDIKGSMKNGKFIIAVENQDIIQILRILSDRKDETMSQTRLPIETLLDM